MKFWMVKGNIHLPLCTDDIILFMQLIIALFNKHNDSDNVNEENNEASIIDQIK